MDRVSAPTHGTRTLTYRGGPTVAKRVGKRWHWIFVQASATLLGGGAKRIGPWAEAKGGQT